MAMQQPGHVVLGISLADYAEAMDAWVDPYDYVSERGSNRPDD